MNFQVRFFAWLLSIVFITSGHALAGEKIRHNATKDKRQDTVQYTTTRQTTYYRRTPSADAMAADLLIARPCWLVETVVGAGLFVVSLPFSAPSKSVDAARRSFIVKPARATFRRPLGDFSSIE